MLLPVCVSMYVCVHSVRATAHGNMNACKQDSATSTGVAKEILGNFRCLMIMSNLSSAAALAALPNSKNSSASAVATDILLIVLCDYNVIMS